MKIVEASVRDAFDALYLNATKILPVANTVQRIVYIKLFYV